MFSAAARGIPSFGDLSWKAPVFMSNDPTVALDANTQAPVGGISIGQTLTANANGAFDAQTSFGSPGTSGSFSVGQRVLVTSESGTKNGIYTITSLGSAGTKWKLTRALDADTTVELPNGTTVFAFTAIMGGGLIFAGPVIWFQSAANTWQQSPQSVQDFFTNGFLTSYGEFDLHGNMQVGPTSGYAFIIPFATSETRLQNLTDSAILRLIGDSGSASHYTALIASREGDTTGRMIIGYDGGQQITGVGFGPGNAARDAFIYRTGTKAVQYDADGAGTSAIWATKGTRPGFTVISFKGTIASGSATLTLDPVGAAVAGNGLIMPWAGKIIAVSARTAAARTAGSATCTATIGGTNKTTASAVIDGTNPNGKATAVADAVADTFAANSAMRAQVVTSSWTPTANAIQVDVYVIFDAVG